MGLDMFAYRVRNVGHRPLPDVDLRLPDLDGAQPTDGDVLVQVVDRRLYYWRKHPDLHGWMEQLYRDKGGADPVFNCRSVRLMAEDLDALEACVTSGALPRTTGFFFGESQPEDRVCDLEFIALARQAIAAGDAVYYDSWW
jgi:hypothetical protein